MAKKEAVPITITVAGNEEVNHPEFNEIERLKHHHG